ncbi:MAG: hypothetical protein EBT69_09620 [Verrucomicrobia bacterium]|nr:hypothetical protein [Verrucomicrobiota bacterium]
MTKARAALASIPVAKQKRNTAGKVAHAHLHLTAPVSAKIQSNSPATTAKFCPLTAKRCSVPVARNDSLNSSPTPSRYPKSIAAINPEASGSSVNPNDVALSICSLKPAAIFANQTPFSSPLHSKFSDRTFRI